MFVFQVYSPATKVFKDKPEGWFEYQLKELGNLKGNIDKLNANPKDSDARNAASKNIGTLITNLTNQYPISTRPGQITASLDSLNSMYEQLNSNKFAAIGFKLAPIEKSLKDTFEKFKGQSYDEFFKPADASQKSGEGSENKKTEAKDDKNDKTTDKKVNKTETPKLSTDEMQKAIADYVKDWPAGVNVKGKDRVEYENVSKHEYVTLFEGQKKLGSIDLVSGKVVGKGIEKDANIGEDELVRRLHAVLINGVDCTDFVERILTGATTTDKPFPKKGEYQVKVQADKEGKKWATLYHNDQKVAFVTVEKDDFVVKYPDKLAKEETLVQSQVFYQMYLAMGGKSQQETNAAGTKKDKGGESADKKTEESSVKLVPRDNIEWLPDFAKQFRFDSGTVFAVADIGNGRSDSPAQQNAIANDVFKKMTGMGLLGADEIEGIKGGDWSQKQDDLTDLQQQQIAVFKFFYAYERARGSGFLGELCDELKGESVADIVTRMQNGTKGEGDAQGLAAKGMLAQTSANSRKWWGSIATKIATDVPNEEQEEEPADEPEKKIQTPKETAPAPQSQSDKIDEAKKTLIDKKVQELVDAAEKISQAKANGSDMEPLSQAWYFPPTTDFGSLKSKKAIANAPVRLEDDFKAMDAFVVLQASKLPNLGSMDAPMVVGWIKKYDDAKAKAPIVQSNVPSTVQTGAKLSLDDAKNTLISVISKDTVLMNTRFCKPGVDFSKFETADFENVANQRDLEDRKQLDQRLIIEAMKETSADDIKDKVMGWIKEYDKQKVPQSQSSVTINGKAVPITPTNTATASATITQQQGSTPATGTVQVPETGIESFDKFRGSPEVVAAYAAILKDGGQDVLNNVVDDMKTTGRNPDFKPLASAEEAAAFLKKLADSYKSSE